MLSIHTERKVKEVLESLGDAKYTAKAVYKYTRMMECTISIVTGRYSCNRVDIMSADSPDYTVTDVMAITREINKFIKKIL
jgi:lauroyl/myristoyl acyltransferase